MLEAGLLTDAEIIPAIARRHVFPCWFGSALKLDGVEELLAAGWTAIHARLLHWIPLGRRCSRSRRMNRVRA